MEKIDRIWLKEKLGNERGAKAEVSRVLGISADKVSRILSGERKIQADEATTLFNYFNELDQKKVLFDELWLRVDEADKDLLIDAAKRFSVDRRSEG